MGQGFMGPRKRLDDVGTISAIHYKPDAVMDRYEQTFRIKYIFDFGILRLTGPSIPPMIKHTFPNSFSSYLQ